ncbi:MAG: SIMPL domain-containing protein [Propionibacteriaceae bacterium]|jgi:uncharacterized protein YggE|nr:SIMPL domain-containing protein [Propionibacteriaceae bacterium]
MTVTDIKVTGSARDTRVPDRAELHLQISKWGRDWATTHRTVAASVGALSEAIKQLEVDSPQALYDHSIAQVSQSTWSDEIGAAYAETVDVTMVFTDFQVMSDWIFAHSNETVHIQGIDWQLSPAAKNDLAISLSVEAMRDARRRAETYAVAAGLTIIGINTIADPGLMGEPRNDPMPFARVAAMKANASADVIDITPSAIETVAQVEAHFLAEPDPSATTYHAATRGMVG